MILVELTNNKGLAILDSKRRFVRTTIPLNKPDDVFRAHWGGQIELYPDDYTVLTEEAYSYKGLKHYVAKYMLEKDIPGVPNRYIEAYKGVI